MNKQSDAGYRWVILAILTGAQLTMSLGAYSWGPLAPFLRSEYGVSRAEIGSLVAALYFTTAAVSIPAGVAVDRWGARIILAIALVTMGLSFCSIYRVEAFHTLLILSALSGTGYGVINQVSTKGLILWFERNSRALAMGIKQTGVTLGGALGALALPAVSMALGWRWAAFMAGALMVLMAAAAVYGYREQPVGKVNPGRPSGGMAPDWITRLADPGFRRDLFILSSVGMLLAFSQTSITSFWVLYLQEELGFSPGAAGASLTLLMASGTAARVCWGIISDRFFGGDRKRPVIILCLLASAGALGVAFFPAGWPGLLIYLLGALLGFVFMGWNAIFLVLCAEIAGPRLAGSFTGVMGTLVAAGVVIGPPVFGATADAAGYFWSWLILSLFGLTGACSFAYLAAQRTENS